jgi:pyruvate kinase
MNDEGNRDRRVKIIATLGPASASPDVVRQMVAAGADGFRLNGAHVQPAEIGGLVELVRNAEREAGRPLAALFDLAGPKLRVSRDVGRVELAFGQVVAVGAAGRGATVRIEGFDPAVECPVGTRISLHDGKVALLVQAVRDGLVQAEVMVGGEVAGGMGVNLPDVETSLPSLTEHDLVCLAAAHAADIDLLALSFVRRGEEVADLRARIAARSSGPPIIAKLEKAQAVAAGNLESILDTADMAMIARGDLGAETAPEQVPVLQKSILRAARARGVPVITATEMLESMIREVRPTRAEASDVANAVLDGSDALLLTAETAIGAHPVLAVAACSRIACVAEGYPAFGAPWSGATATGHEAGSIADAVAAAAVVAAEELEAEAIVCFTTSGRTARLVARHRPTRPILALTPSLGVARALALVWGLRPQVSPSAPADHEGVVRLAANQARRHGLANEGGVLVITHGAPLGELPATNLMRVHQVGRE